MKYGQQKRKSWETTWCLPCESVLLSTQTHHPPFIWSFHSSQYLQLAENYYKEGNHLVGKTSLKLKKLTHHCHDHPLKGRSDQDDKLTCPRSTGMWLWTDRSRCLAAALSSCNISREGHLQHFKSSIWRPMTIPVLQDKVPIWRQINYMETNTKLRN